MNINIWHCTLADKDHKKYKRQYAHTYHYKNVICVAKSFFNLPDEHYYGLLAHEIGHILMGKDEHEEYEADMAANEYFGITIKYKNSKYGDFLQYITRKDINKLKQVMR